MFKFKKRALTVEAAANLLSANREKIIKSFSFINYASLPILGIVAGDKKVSEKKPSIVSRSKKIRKDNSTEVKELTGYDVGAVPPVRHKKTNKTFIDEKIMIFDKVTGDGGEVNTLLEIKPTEIKRLTNGEVRDISE